MSEAESLPEVVHRYYAFGLIILSDIHLPELPESTLGRKADIRIVLSEQGCHFKAPVSESNHFAINHHEALLKAEGFSLTVADGKKIIIHCNQIEKYLSMIRLRILGAGIGLLLQQRGYLVLHGATIVGEKGAAIILGNSGDGKSTLCAQLVQLGYRLLGDDKCVVTIDKNSYYALPTLPYIKLTKSSIGQLGFSHRKTMEIAPAHNKVYVNLGNAFEFEAMPITAAFVLDKANDVSLSQITQMQTFDTLIQHSYRKQKLIGGGLHKTHFMHCQQMAKSLKMYRYQRPLLGGCLNKPSPDFLACIEELIGSGS